MKKLAVFIALISLFSCASVSEYQRTYRGELEARDQALFGQAKSAWILPTYSDSSIDLLVGLYAFSLAKNPPKYPLFLYQPYLFSPLYSFSDLMIYESMIKSMTTMETFKLQLEVQRILDEVRREAAKIKD